MRTIDYYQETLITYEKALLGGAWPLPPVEDATYNLDIGIDPSMSSSGICGILRSGNTILACEVLNHKTAPHTPTPLRLSSVVPVTIDLINKLESKIKPPAKLHITILLEEPPTNMSSSAWLFALNQMLWMGFGPADLRWLVDRGYLVTVHQYAIGNTQLKQLYFFWSEQKKFGWKYGEIKSSKSKIVKIIKSVVDPSELFKFLPKRYNNDVAEAIAMACCAGACSRMDNYLTPPAETPYGFIPVKELHGLMTSKKVNTHMERLGWIYRPLTHAFGWTNTPRVS